MDRFEEAEGVLEAVLSKDEFHAEARYLLALCREKASDLYGAMVHYRKAIYSKPAFAMPHFHLGRLAQRVGRYSLARQELRRALKLMPSESPEHTRLFGGGFTNQNLVVICQRAIHALGISDS